MRRLLNLLRGSGTPLYTQMCTQKKGMTASQSYRAVRFANALYNCGGRPTKLTADDNALIAQSHLTRQSAKQIAAYFGVSDDTIRRSDGWEKPTGKNFRKISGTGKNRKNQDIDIDIDIEKDIEKEKYTGAVRALSSFTSGDEKEEWLANGGQIIDDMDQLDNGVD